MAISGYIIEKYNNMANAYTCHRLIEEARKLDIDLQLVGVHDTYITKEGVWNKGEFLEKRDFVINRYKYGKLKGRINALGERCYNDINLFEDYINKYEQIRKIKSEHFSIPKYLLSTSLIGYEKLSSYLGEPFVAKGLESSMGREIYLISNSKEYELLRHNNDINKEWLFEEFISNSYGKDLRIFTIRDKTIACMIRKANSDFRANVALGASVESLATTPIINSIVEDIYKQTKLDFLGVDLLFGTNGYYFCEINVMPGLEGIESASGINISKLIIETIKKDFGQ
jgi:RimK family alpha-L-glutamate ligase